MQDAVKTIGALIERNSGALIGSINGDGFPIALS
jgi:hypothetical protein